MTKTIQVEQIVQKPIQLGRLPRDPPCEFPDLLGAQTVVVVFDRS